MKIEHAALYAENLEKEKEFFCRYFGAGASSLYHNPKTGFSSYFLTFEAGARLEIMHIDSAERQEAGKKRVGYDHLAFSLESREEVEALTRRLSEDGYPVLSGPRVTGDGYFESCIADPEGNRVEITVSP
ncbi:MAG: VOC family protein [Candidatus Heritagella sp.]